MAQKVKLLCLFFLPSALSFFLRVHSPLHHPHHHHHGPRNHHLYHHDHDVHDYRAIVRHHGHFYHRPVHHHHLLPPLHRHHLHSYDHHKYHQKYQEPLYHEPKYGSYEVPKYSSYSSDDQSYHHDLHHRADDGEDAIGGGELEGAAQLCQHLEGTTRALCFLCGEEDEDSACWKDPCWLAREEDQEECRLQVESELVDLEKKNVEIRDQGNVRDQSLIGDDDKSNKNLGDNSGDQIFVTSDVDTKENHEQAKDLRNMVDVESTTEQGWHGGLEGVRVQDSLGGGEPGLSDPLDLKTGLKQRKEGVQNSDPTALVELLGLNTVPV